MDDLCLTNYYDDMKIYLLLNALLVVGLNQASAVEVVSDDFEGGALGANWDASSQATISAGTGAEASANFVTLAAAGSGDILGTVIEGGSSDVEIDFYVRIRDAGSRRFNLMVSNGEVVAPDGASINLRYQNGSWQAFGGGWQALPNLGALTGEAWHRVLVTCKGWGSSGATFDVELSDADGTTFTSSQTGVNLYQGGDPNTAPVGAVSFTSNWGNSRGYDVDSVAVNTLVTVVDDPNISITSGTPFNGLALEPNPPVQTADVVIENTGTANDFIIADTSAFSGASGPSFSITTALPVTVSPGMSTTIQVEFDAAGGNGTYAASLDLASNDASNPTLGIPMSVFVPSASGNQFGNANFDENTMALPKWTSNQGAALAITGFAPDSTTSCDEYFSELALWFGLPSGELAEVFPNLSNFYSYSAETPPIGFMA